MAVPMKWVGAMARASSIWLSQTVKRSMPASTQALISVALPGLHMLSRLPEPFSALRSSMV